MTDRLFVVGPGRMGLALGQALWQAEAVDELTYCGRRPEPPSHPLFIQGLARYCFGLEQPRLGTTVVLLAVPDDILPEMAHTLAGQGPAPDACVAFHLSGALRTDVLAPLHERGYAVGSLHPLQAVAHPVTGAERLAGSYFAVAGEPAAVRAGRRLVGALEGGVLTVPVSRRPLYHAGATIASNSIPALVAAAARLFVEAGIPEAEAVDAILPLVRGTLENIREGGIIAALTGPIVRGDAETVRIHMQAMEPREREVYRTLARELLVLARARGLDEEVAEEIQSVLIPHRGSPGNTPTGDGGETSAART